jgi:hypothetical protein
MARANTFTNELFGKAKGLFGREAEAKAAAAKPVPARKVPQNFHAVSIVAGSRACAEARALEEGQKRYLSRQAPVLPLKNCNCATCECRYVHHEDRRKGPRRTRDFGVSIAGYEGPENRKVKRGRRKSDP